MFRRACPPSAITKSRQLLDRSSHPVGGFSIHDWHPLRPRYSPFVRTADFLFDLPSELIAQFPTPRRDASRLMVMHRDRNRLEHRVFGDVPEYLRPGDVLIFNNSRVINARLRGVNVRTGGAFEILLLEENASNDWWAMLRPGKRARMGTVIQFTEKICATVTAINPEGHRRLQFSGTRNLLHELDHLGEIPLPPYIRRPVDAAGRPVVLARTPSASHPSCDPVAALDNERYQTVFASVPGSVAAPTAGLHFTGELLAALRARGVEIHFVTLHVGLGTFAPVKADTVEAHVMHEERYEISEATAQAINQARREQRRIIAVGTTSLRALESSIPSPPRRNGKSHPLEIRPGAHRTRIFIYPPYDFRTVDALITNFHLPGATLLMLVSAFAAPGQTEGREKMLAAYATAIRQRYRFFSYGDAMLLL